MSGPSVGLDPDNEDVSVCVFVHLRWQMLEPSLALTLPVYLRQYNSLAYLVEWLLDKI